MAKLYVGNLPFTATEQDVRKFFEPVPLKKVVICTDRETGRPRGFGFVEIEEPKAAQNAIRDLHGTDFGGRTVVVNEAIDKPRGERSAPGADRTSAPPSSDRGSEKRFGHDKPKQRGGRPSGRRREDYE